MRGRGPRLGTRPPPRFSAGNGLHSRGTAGHDFVIQEGGGADSVIEKVAADQLGPDVGGEGRSSSGMPSVSGAGMRTPRIGFTVISPSSIAVANSAEGAVRGLLIVDPLGQGRTGTLDAEHLVGPISAKKGTGSDGVPAGYFGFSTQMISALPLSASFPDPQLGSGGNCPHSLSSAKSFAQPPPIAAHGLPVRNGFPGHVR